MYGALDVSTSGLVAQRTRLAVVSANLANADAILNAAGEYEPYRRRSVAFATGDPVTGAERGVHVAAIREDPGPLLMRLEADSPYADANGYVGYPNVDPVLESMNAMEAIRAYEANITAVEATKSMLSLAMEILS